LGRRRFLEVIAPDPTLPPGVFARQLAAMTTPRLIMWAARTPSAAEAAARAKAEGYQAVVAEGHRARPDGRVVRWTNVFVSEHGGRECRRRALPVERGRHEATGVAGALAARKEAGRLRVHARRRIARDTDRRRGARLDADRHCLVGEVAAHRPSERTEARAQA